MAKALLFHNIWRLCSFIGGCTRSGLLKFDYLFFETPCINIYACFARPWHNFMYSPNFIIHRSLSAFFHSYVMCKHNSIMQTLWRHYCLKLIIIEPQLYFTIQGTNDHGQIQMRVLPAEVCCWNLVSFCAMY